MPLFMSFDLFMREHLVYDAQFLVFSHIFSHLFLSSYLWQAEFMTFASIYKHNNISIFLVQIKVEIVSLLYSTHVILNAELSAVIDYTISLNITLLRSQYQKLNGNDYGYSYVYLDKMFQAHIISVLTAISILKTNYGFVLNARLKREKTNSILMSGLSTRRSLSSCFCRRLSKLN
ncbi:hypothetical protein EDC96DRAFT_546762 [Choanephora cucurbitarum]|nr:hypothetical protein EDC96DRAFT_546762 [Choanephora cucurbitarum]